MDETPTVNFSVQRGDDDDKIISFWTQAGAAVPLTQLSAIRFTLRENWATDEGDDTSAVFSASLGAGISAYDDNSVLLELPSNETVTWLSPQYVHDVEVVTAGGKRVTTQKGFVGLKPDASRG